MITINNMKKFIITISLIFALIWINNVNAGFFSKDNQTEKIEVSKDFSLSYNTVSLLNSKLKSFCIDNKLEECSLKVLVSKSKEDKIESLNITWKKEEINLLNWNINWIYKEMKEIKLNEFNNQKVFFNNLYQKSLEKENMSTKNHYIMYFLLLMILSVALWAEVIWPRNWIILGTIWTFFLIILYFVNLHSIKYEEVKYWKEGDNLIFNVIDYKFWIENLSSEELKQRIHMDDYYIDVLLEDEKWNPIKELSNKRKLVFREETKKWFEEIYWEKTDNITFHSSEGWLIIRIHKQPIKEKLIKIWEIWISIGLIYAKHKVWSYLSNWNWTALAFNNLTTLSMASDLMILLQEDMTSYYIPE